MANKGKKASKGSAEANNTWDVALVNETIDDSSWSSHLVFLIPENVESDSHIKAMSSVANGGNRKRFSVIDKESMLATAKEDAKLAAAAPSGGGGGRKSKQTAPVPAAEKPLHVQVCEQVVSVLNSGEQVPAPLLARLLKYMVLKKRTQDIAERNAKLKESTEPPKPQASAGGDGKGKKGGGGRTSKAGGKKGKETPAPEAPAIPIPAKPPTTMKKRGEEDLDSKYINDEPSDGPSSYFLVTGFTSVELFQQLASVKLHAHVLVKVLGTADVATSNADVTEPNEAEQSQLEEYSTKLATFWANVDRTVKSSPSGSMLRDMAMIELASTKVSVPESEEEKVVYGQELFDSVALRVYHLLEQHMQYKQYLDYLDLQPLSLGPGEARSEQDTKGEESGIEDMKRSSPAGVDQRYYKDLLSVVPDECVSIPIILHCMVEQVSATLSNSKPSVESQPEVAPAIMEELNNLFSVFVPPTQTTEDASSDNDKLAISSPSKECTILPYGDVAKEKTFQLKNSEQLNIAESESTVNQLSGVASLLLPSPEENVYQKADIHALEHFCLSEEITPLALNHALILMSLEHVKLPNASTPPGHCYTNTQMRGGLLFDHPFTIPTRPHVSQDKALLPVSETTSSVRISSGGPTGAIELQLPDPHSDLSEYSTLQVLKKRALLQLIQSLQATHPYVEVFHHQHNQATVMVVHTGFDGSPLYTYEFNSQAHSKVGFQNYLQYVAETYGDIIDKAIAEDAEKQEEFEEEHKVLLEEKLKAQQKLEEERISTPQVEQEGKSSAKSKKGSAASSAKRSKVPSKEATPRGSSSNLLASLPQYVKPKRFVAYDIGDRVLLTKCKHTTVFTSDGVQVQAEKNVFVEGDSNISVSLLSKGHKISCVLTAKQNTTDDNTEPVSKSPSKNEDKENGQSNETDEEAPTEEPVKGVPQPPSHLKYAAMCASFKDSLRVSLSHYGPQGNGKLPYSPNKPSILDVPARQGSASGSRPQSQQGSSPQKLSKKQQEQQQQLLEQQRLMEEQLEKERKVAEKVFKEECDKLERHNKYQQLFASTLYGLHVHCQIMVNLDANVGISDGSDGYVVVRQSYPVKSNGVQLCEKRLGVAFQEKRQCCLPDGTVVRYLTDGSVVIQCADSSIYRTATGSELNEYCRQVQESSDSKQEDSTTQQLEAEVSAEAVGRITSANKVMFADAEGKNDTNQLPPESVWVITKPDGKRYLWKHVVAQPRSSGDETVDESKKEGEENADGTKEESTDEEKSDNIMSEVSTSPVVPLDPLALFSATDPVTNEVYVTREDNVVLLHRPDGTYISEFADGTRFTVTPTNSKLLKNSAPSKLPSQVMTECPGFARVTHYLRDNKCQLEFPDGSAITCSTDGSYTVSKVDDYKLRVTRDGRALYSTCGGTYTLSHTGDGDILSGCDGQKNKYLIDSGGVGSVVQVKDTTIPIHQEFKPRYFVINSDHTAYELLNTKRVQSSTSKAKSHPTTIVLKEPLLSESSSSSTTIIEPLVRDNAAAACVVPYAESTIIPENLRSNNATKHQEESFSAKELKKPRRFGTTAGKGLMIGSYVKPPPVKPYIEPNALKYRQYLHLQPVVESRRESILSAIASYISWGQDQEKKREAMQPVDQRTDAEKLAAENLRAKWDKESDAFKTSTPNISAQYAQARSEEARASVTMSVPRSPLVEEFLENSKKELQEAEAIKEALRHRIIPPYFESDEGKRFLQSLGPDMSLLSSKLARPKQSSSQHQVSGHSTPSTLHSTSLTLPLEEPVSPFQSELEQLNSTSKLRPSHPTPDHAHGRGTPTEIRPTNPTPLQAVVTGMVSSKDTSSNASCVLPPVTSDGNQPLKSILVSGSGSADNSTLESTDGGHGRGSKDESSIPVAGQAERSDKTGAEDVKRVSIGPRIEINTTFATVEEPVRRKIRTSSTLGGGAATMRGFEVSPDAIDFGVLCEGSTYSFSLTVRNTGVDSCRFKIKQPPPSTGIKVLYSPGAVAAGMKRTITVEIFAMAVGAQGELGMGSIYHELEVISETSILRLPIKAIVLTSSAYSNRQADHPSGGEAKGVTVVSHRPASREDVTRPQRTTYSH